MYRYQPTDASGRAFRRPCTYPWKGDRYHSWLGNDRQPVTVPAINGHMSLSGLCSSGDSEIYHSSFKRWSISRGLKNQLFKVHPLCTASAILCFPVSSQCSEGVLKEIVVATGSPNRAWRGPRLSLMAIKRLSKGIEDVSV